MWTHEGGAEVDELGVAVALDPGAVSGVVFCSGGGGSVVGGGLLEVSEKVVEDCSCFGLGWGEFGVGVGHGIAGYGG